MVILIYKEDSLILLSKEVSWATIIPRKPLSDGHSSIHGSLLEIAILITKKDGYTSIKSLSEMDILIYIHGSLLEEVILISTEPSQR